MHIGAKHNKILDFVTPEIAEQLNRLNVKDEMEQRAIALAAAQQQHHQQQGVQLQQGASLASTSQQPPKPPENSVNPLLGLITSSWQQY